MWLRGAAELASCAVARLHRPQGPTPAAVRGRAGLDRRSVLRGGVAGFGAVALGGLVAACSDSSPTVAEGVDAGADQNLEPLFPRDVRFLATERTSRLPYTLVDAEGVPFASIEDTARFTVRFDGEQVGEPIEVEPHDDGVPRPYLPLYTTFPRAGVYDIEAEHAGTRMTSQVQVYPVDEVDQPLVGSELPAAQTATPDRTFDVDPICTLAPQCPLHDVNLADVVGTGVPIVVLLATPAYCQTSACGPILDLLVEQAAGLPDDVVVIHSEVYQDPKQVEDLNQATLAPLPMTYDMLWEPSLFVADSAGMLVARGDIVVDRVEMAEMLALAV